jgi:hypothetical protein
VQLSEFWMLIEQARADASDDHGTWPSSGAIGAALTGRLVLLPPERIVEFHQSYLRTASRAHQWRVCASAFLIWNYISDDGFSDFKAGLVGLGHDAFEQVVADPDVLAGHPMVRAIAAGRVDRFALAGEAIQFAGPQAYERCTDDADAFWEALDSQPAEAADGKNRPAEPWSGRFGSPEDAAHIPPRLPRLHAFFASSESR